MLRAPGFSEDAPAGVWSPGCHLRQSAREGVGSQRTVEGGVFQAGGGQGAWALDVDVKPLGSLWLVPGDRQHGEMLLALKCLG